LFVFDFDEARRTFVFLALWCFAFAGFDFVAVAFGDWCFGAFGRLAE
jgi:hypothetical protein